MNTFDFGVFVDRVNVVEWLYLTVIFSLMFVAWAVRVAELEDPAPVAELARVNPAPEPAQEWTAWEVL